MVEKYDVVILGAGIIGCSVARELSRYKLKILVLEKDVEESWKAPKVRRGIIHTGYSEDLSTSKGQYISGGFQKYKRLKAKLRLNLMPMGSLILGYSREDEEEIYKLYQASKDNGKRKVRILKKGKIRRLEPHTSKEATIALFDPDTCLIDPTELRNRLYENAKFNGVKFVFNQELKEVKVIDKSKKEVITDKDIFLGDILINAVSKNVYNSVKLAGIFNSKGNFYENQYLVLDKKDRWLAKRVILKASQDIAKEISINPTWGENIILGPMQKEDNLADHNNFNEIMQRAAKLSSMVSLCKVVSNFMQIEAKESLFIKESKRIKGIFSIISNPFWSLTMAPLIAEEIVAMIRDKGVLLNKKVNFYPKSYINYRKGK